MFFIILRTKSKFLNEAPGHPARPGQPYWVPLHAQRPPCTPLLPISTRVGAHSISSISNQHLSSTCSHPTLHSLTVLTVPSVRWSVCRLHCPVVLWPWGACIPWPLAHGRSGTKEAVRRLSLDKYILFSLGFGAMCLVILHFSWTRKLRLQRLSHCSEFKYKSVDLSLLPCTVPRGGT